MGADKWNNWDLLCRLEAHLGSPQSWSFEILKKTWESVAENSRIIYRFLSCPGALRRFMAAHCFFSQRGFDSVGLNKQSTLSLIKLKLVHTSSWTLCNTLTSATKNPFCKIILVPCPFPGSFSLESCSDGLEVRAVAWQHQPRPEHRTGLNWPAKKNLNAIHWIDRISPMNILFWILESEHWHDIKNWSQSWSRVAQRYQAQHC